MAVARVDDRGGNCQMMVALLDVLLATLLPNRRHLELAVRLDLDE